MLFAPIGNKVENNIENENSTLVSPISEVDKNAGWTKSVFKNPTPRPKYMYNVLLIPCRFISPTFLNIEHKNR